MDDYLLKFCEVLGKKSSKSSKEILGNTDTKISKQPSPAKHYCFTLNNYSNNELNIVPTSLGSVGHYIYGFEVGAEGTPHLQGYIELHHKMRITEFKKIEGLGRTHFEKCKGSQADNLKYCRKGGNYISNYWEDVQLIVPTYYWQLDILQVIASPAHGRHIHWFWESIGGVGKSSFAKYLCSVHNAIYIDEGKKSDLINIVYNIPNITCRSIIVIDVPRDNGNTVSYKAIEQIKNGMICNTKYETGMRLFNPPHIIIFANMPPEEHKLSADRWKITEISSP
ncbi:replication associated protein [Lake Sarah-associated circular virus-19]|uniref:replication associated protein n=1 Tax=Lake Sarah-associated circular virus-19 TaxID=1685745 RepID=UPI000777B9B4|nr:replication associated protein [Lake Sarah-associated circular virus-19]ALE29649.1 replication associated protein [Lake Sarah-associated circular virus-19]